MRAAAGADVGWVEALGHQLAGQAYKLPRNPARATYKVPLQEAIHEAERADEILRREIQQHVSQWQERDHIYSTLHWDVGCVPDNVARVLGGAQPVPLEKVRVARALRPKAAVAALADAVRARRLGAS